MLLQALLEQQLAVERSKVETEKKRFQNALDEKVVLIIILFLDFDWKQRTTTTTINWYSIPAVQ